MLEYSGGNTFTGRVFPIQPKGYNRVLIAYEELLPMMGDQVVYRFPLPNRKLSEMQIMLQANQADFTETVFYPKEAKKETGGGRVVYSGVLNSTTIAGTAHNDRTRWSWSVQAQSSAQALAGSNR